MTDPFVAIGRSEVDEGGRAAPIPAISAAALSAARPTPMRSCTTAVEVRSEGSSARSCSCRDWGDWADSSAGVPIRSETTFGEVYVDSS